MRQAPTSARDLLTRIIRRHRLRLTGCFALLAMWQICEALVPVLIGVIIDQAVAPSDGRALLIWGGALVVLFGFLSYGYRFGSRLGFGAMQQEIHLLRMEIADHTLAPRGVRTSLLTGETVSLATSDAEAVGTVARSFGSAIASAASVILSAVILLRTDLVIGLVVLIGVPLVLAAIQVVSPAISRRSHVQQSRIARTSGTATDFVRGLRVLKGVGAEDAATARYRLRSQEAKVAGIHTARSYGAMEGLTTGLSGLFLAVVALIAGLRALDGTITIGELVAVVGLTQFLAEPLGALGRVSAQVAGAHASAQRIVDFLQSPPLIETGDRTPIGRATGLSLDDVHTGPLDGLTVSSRPGELLGLVVEDPGAAGTLVRLLAGEVAADDLKGDVSLDGEPLSDLTVAARRARLLVSPHHPDLFEGTLRSNVDPRGTHTGAELQQVLAASVAEDVVHLHAEGLDQPVVADASTLSGGQRQRVALARALTARPATLVLHDPTTAVDAVTEQRIAEGLRGARHPEGSDLTTWLITSSPALLAQADRVVVLRGGRVVATGTHHELSHDADYRDLVLR
ncbi:ABC transporter ATP-binding protein [Luteipulveratus mongoliensis]|uniref:ABC transporter permease n=1 Tax=Luteipulveratus mongoliensis TaxID=571913 RepID=A0A0K1JH20_9MICO|nr:ABC transporter ATP-binding protein [Luteipulveratus mongoliensis]AKU15885.1 hypothetical protein VV02_08515 [Luteipulveratus mongoliensis]